MKIQTATLQFTSQRHALINQMTHERVRSWVNTPATTARPTPAMNTADTVQLSAAAQAQQSAAIATDTALTPDDALKVGLLIKMIEALTGKQLQFVLPGQLAQELAQAQMTTANKLPNCTAPIAAPPPAAPASAGFGIEYDAQTQRQEIENTQFTATGIVTTTDGQEIAIAVELNMSRAFIQNETVQIRLGDAARLKDPLVLNFNGTAAELTATRYQFDIDADGSDDQIAFVGNNSGFLALDRNNDGVVNNGRELFGALTGDGFAELAAGDANHNGWIDENDAMYAHLRIWSKDNAGNDQLLALGVRGVGAIYLGQVTTPFAIKNADNALLGQVRSSGLFLQENGAAGTVQQIDLVV